MDILSLPGIIRRPAPPGGRRRRATGAALAMAIAGHLQASVVFHEIHFHPASEDVREEFIELYNAGNEPVNLAGWRLTRGVEFTFPAVTLPPGGFCVVAADLATFSSLYPDVTNVVGNWTGRLSNSRDTLQLVDARGELVDAVTYADEGDWAVRLRSPPDRGQRGWTWKSAADGGGSSLELMQPALSNDPGQNWAPSRVAGGTPGRPNSVAQTNLAPMIVQVQHWPAVPRSTDPVWITARLLDEQPGGATLRLYWRLDGSPAFETVPMHDDGQHEDGAPFDGRFGAAIPPQTNDAVVEFYLEARDDLGQVRLWPAPAVETNGVILGPVANALYQVDDTRYAGPFPLYKIVLTEAERRQLAYIGSATDGSALSDAQMNATFISQDATGLQVRYLIGVRNRGHGSRTAKPNNYRVNFRSDEPWQGVVALNLNAQYTHLQILGATLALKAGLAGAFSRPVQVRVNNRNLANNGPQTYGGCYAANEVVNSDWAERWFPEDPAGNVYRALRDIAPSSFTWRGSNYLAYTNTWFKWTNNSENDWSDLLTLLRILGTNDLLTADAVRSVIHWEQWMTYFAVMALLDNRETSLYNGYNDDYVLYAGASDRRFRLMYYDLDTILGQGNHPGSPTLDFLQWTRDADLPALQRLWSLPETPALFYHTLDRLLRTAFSQAEFDLTVDQTLRDFVPGPVRDALKQWMAARRSHLAAQIAPHLQTNPPLPRARISGEPRSPTPLTTATLHVGGSNVVAYRFRLNGGVWSDPQPVEQAIVLTDLAHGSTNRVEVLGADAQGRWQAESEPTPSASWVVLTNWPGVRINEVLANNRAAVAHEGTYPDAIELYNETAQPVDLSGMRLTDNPATPGKFTFPAGTVLAPHSYLVLWANNPDGTSGLHTGFALNQDGEGVYLFDRPSRGGALLDQVTFGLQLPDLSIGRIGNTGEFVLTQPTLGGTNMVQPLGDPHKVRINEWLARPQQLAPRDYVELYNPEPLPVALGGLYLTDNPIGLPRRHRIAPLSFIGPQGFRRFWADNDPQQGADHVAFQLSAEQGLIALLGNDLSLIDVVAYGPQQIDVAQGRVPDGGTTIQNLTLPTPGAANSEGPPPCVVTVLSIPLLTYTNLWRYQQTAGFDTQDWARPDYDDSHWPVGPGLLAYESNPAITGLVNTVLQDPRRPPAGSGLLPGHAYYFRTTFLLTNAPDEFLFQASTHLDDGAVIYLNGREAVRIRMPEGPVSPATLATGGPGSSDEATQPESFFLPASLVVHGTNTVAVSVHQQATNSSDIVWGLSIVAVRTLTNCGAALVVLNELQARNSRITNDLGRSADWLEILNPDVHPVDLTGLSLSDDLRQPRKWVFPPGTRLGGGERLVVWCDPDLPPSAQNTGFGLAAAGGAVYLFNAPEQGGTVLDAVFYGAQPADFSLARIPDGMGDWLLALPTPGDLNVPASLGNPARVRINEWMAHPDQGEDWIELYNPEPQPVELSGMALSDDPTDRARSPFPARSYIGPESYWLVYAEGRQTGGADHARFRLAAEGGWIGLYLSTGQQIDGILYGPQVLAVSQGRLPDGAPAFAAFPDTASPGGPNYVLLPTVRINEILTHTDPPLEDAIELYNASHQPVDLSGWYLSDDPVVPRKFRIPPGTVLPAGGFVVFYQDQFGNPLQEDTLVPFQLDSAHGGEVVLSEVNPDGSLTGRRARAAFGAAANGVSLGRIRTSWREEFVALRQRSFGADNPSTLEEFRTGRGAPNSAPLVGPLVISEIHCRPVEKFDSTRPGSGQFVELCNLSDQPLLLYDPDAPTNRWRLAGSIDFVFPPQFSLPPRGLALVVDFDPATQPEELAWFRAAYEVPAPVPILGPWSGELDERAGILELYKPDPPQLPPRPDAGFVPHVLVERIQYQSEPPWPLDLFTAGISLQRTRLTGFGNEPLYWIADLPSAGRTTATDSDADGLPDWWERQHGLDPRRGTDMDGWNGDPDGDGQPNGAELVTGSDPRNASDFLYLTAGHPNASGLVLTFRAAPGRRYHVLCSDEGPTGPWYAWTNLVAELPETIQLVDPRAPIQPRFYRLQVQLEP
ncbi:lamin tail domain-containing protein [Limisphaera sp. VF-2]|uniref:lamin tail domain-containing protein n=1 Tax=Limisphaera sp. VF-2 TaxID=3400418 RepID=UPI001759A9B7